VLLRLILVFFSVFSCALRGRAQGPIYTMGKARNARNKSEGSFLESVKDVLLQLHLEMVAIRETIGELSKQTSLNSLQISTVFLPPPPAPPPYEYDRSTLLECRAGAERLANNVSLPRIVDKRVLVPLSSNPQTLSEFGQVDWDSLNFSVEEIDYRVDDVAVELEYDEITSFIQTDLANEEVIGRMHSPPYRDFHGTLELEKPSDCQAMLAEEIALAQKRARGFQRLRECSAVKSIQKVWKLCRPKVANRIVAPNHHGFTSAKACGPHPGRQVEINNQHDAYDLLTSMQDEKWIKAALSDKVSSGEPRSGSSHSDTGSSGVSQERVVGTNLEEERFGLLLTPYVEYALENFEGLDRAHFLSSKIEVLAERHRISIVMRNTAIRKLFEMSETSLEEIQRHIRDYHFVCTGCAYRFRDRPTVNVCFVCDGVDGEDVAIFDERRCVCNHSGWCKIGSCRDSDSESDDTQSWASSC